MSDILSWIGWILFALMVLVQLSLLLLKKRQAALFTSRVMIGWGVLATILGLLFYFDLGIYGVIILLLGFVLQSTTKDLLERR
ncbi:hypothetical protein EQV77_06740 [Halobacillus fulvus]|nr:hypothetical protein EQV77_06740 [Halobacillus fulvus]